jgi:hypothetical protein
MEIQESYTGRRKLLTARQLKLRMEQESGTSRFSYRFSHLTKQTATDDDVTFQVQLHMLSIKQLL